ncbi:uncharacterized protein LOC122818768 [Drosophila biarmipes]|uniref:uncharacterized protein LOC122818768 n=1 Tax=Drosophila biarmipes TaxID=125945 RepID=UPI0021CCB4F9|nr:uncharacterized protein LOC122818768 [Drosophila biarmipes]
MSFSRTSFHTTSYTLGNSLLERVVKINDLGSHLSTRRYKRAEGHYEHPQSKEGVSNLRVKTSTSKDEQYQQPVEPPAPPPKVQKQFRAREAQNSSVDLVVTIRMENQHEKITLLRCIGAYCRTLKQQLSMHIIGFDSQKLCEIQTKSSLKFIEIELNISKTSIYRILTEHLSLQKVCAWFVPHKLTDVQKLLRTVRLLPFRKNAFADERKALCRRRGHSKGFHRHTGGHTGQRAKTLVRHLLHRAKRCIKAEGDYFE